MIEPRYIIEDITNPVSIGNKIIISHCVNDANKMGSGVAKALFTKWRKVKSDYHKCFLNNINCNLGDVQFIDVEPNVKVANVVGQKDIFWQGNVPPVRYESLRKGFKTIRETYPTYEVHIPFKMGSDLAGGNWHLVLQIITEELCEKDIIVVIYDKYNQRKENK